MPRFQKAKTPNDFKIFMLRTEKSKAPKAFKILFIPVRLRVNP
jgi:hypothetical protein